MKKKIGKAITFLLAAVFLLASLSGCFAIRLILDAPWWNREPDDPGEKKPVIYLYPEETTEVTVTLDYDGVLTAAYPDYRDGWTVTAEPDGTLTDRDGKTYSYLFWEGVGKADYDFSEGFVVKGEESAVFLEEILPKLGLTPREANEFIVFWLPKLQESPYNLISFQGKRYTGHARLTVTPEPDTLLRVFMAWRPLEAPVEVPEQEIVPVDRTGFTVVEWGGAEVKKKKAPPENVRRGLFCCAVRW